MPDDNINDLLIDLLILLKKNNELHNENNELKKKLIMEEIKNEQNKKHTKYD